MSSKDRRPRVVIVYKSFPQYRRSFYAGLREECARRGIDLQLVHGQATAADLAKGDSISLPWATQVRNRFLRVGGRQLIWQPVWRLVRGADLVIVEQASKLLVNYVLQASYLLTGRPPFALWGHGRNFQHESASPAGERVKRFLSRHVRWWFAYNDTSAAVVRSLGMPSERVTSVQNAIDTRGLVAARSRVSDQSLAALRASLALRGDNVGIYAGGMYEEKRLPFLLASCLLIRKEVPDFEMVFLGAGTHADLVRRAAEEHPWIKYLGPVFDEAKVPYFALAKTFLMPGLVGLAVLDAFALEVPLVTTAIDYHSPEVEYLIDGVNGMVVRDTDDPRSYASAVVTLLRDASLRERLKAGCRVARQRYTVEEMITRFADGIVNALARPRNEGTETVYDGNASTMSEV